MFSRGGAAVVAGLLLAGCLWSPIQAATVVWNFEGVVFDASAHTNGALPTGIAAGDIVSGTVRYDELYDTRTDLIPNTSSYYTYYNNNHVSNFSISITIDGYTWSADNGTVSVDNQIPQTLIPSDLTHDAITVFASSFSRPFLSFPSQSTDGYIGVVTRLNDSTLQNTNLPVTAFSTASILSQFDSSPCGEFLLCAGGTISTKDLWQVPDIGPPEAIGGYDISFQLQNITTRIDNIVPPPPTSEKQLYALLVGIRDKGETTENAELRGDLAVELLKDSLAQLPNIHIETLTGSYQDGGVSQSEVQTAIDRVYREMSPGDTFLLYITAHGGFDILGPETTLTQPDEYIQIIPGILTDSALLTDDELYSMLDNTDDVAKWVLIDACYAGGFWGNNYLLDGGDLEKLSNTGLIASAKENEKAKYDKNGYPLITYALADGFTRGPDGFLKADANKDGEVEFDELASYVRDWAATNNYKPTIVYEMALGDPIQFDAQTWNPVSFKTDDFNGVITGNAQQEVPEPNTIGIFAFSLLVLTSALWLRHRRQSRQKTTLAKDGSSTFPLETSSSPKDPPAHTRS